MLAHLHRFVPVTNRYFVEFGFNTNDFTVKANTYRLFLEGWRGLLLDGGHTNTSINLHTEFIKSTNIVRLFRKYDVPHEPDYVSIDLDSSDVWVLDALLEGYRPRIVSAEYSSNVPWNYTLTYPDPAQWDPTYMTSRVHMGLNGQDLPTNHGCYAGGASRAFDMVARSHGYTMVTIMFYSDLFLVRNDLLTDKLMQELQRSTSKLWRNSLYNPGVIRTLENGAAINTWQLEKRMTPAQAATVVDFAEWKRLRANGASMKSAVDGAQKVAGKALVEFAEMFARRDHTKRCYSELRGWKYAVDTGR